jgi:mono/diheme cytochrome c family protein/cytochrome c5
VKLDWEAGMTFARRGARMIGSVLGVAGLLLLGGVIFNGTVSAFATKKAPVDVDKKNAAALFNEGRQIFRYDTFGDQKFWGGALQLHKAIAGEKNGGVGPGVSPKTALSLGLKVDATKIPADVVAALKAGKVNLDDPATTVALLKMNAVVGVKGFFDGKGTLSSLGTTCALCHSTVDDSFAPGIGKRLDGWANRDLNVGAIVAASPSVKPFSDLLGVDQDTVRTVLRTWGPGFYNAELDKDGKAFQPNGKPAGTVIPPAFGLAGVNLGTYTGFGTVTYWNAYVAVTQMHGQGNFYDPRFNDPEKYPLAVKSGSWNVRSARDLVTSKLGPLHYYQLSLKAPKAPKGSFDAEAAKRGKDVFMGKGKCAGCHMPPLYTEPGFNMHKPEEICTDSFQADRSPDEMYRTTPLKGLWTHQKGGFYHDGRFKSLAEVVEHYNGCFGLNLTAGEKSDVVQFLKSR